MANINEKNAKMRARICVYKKKVVPLQPKLGNVRKN